MKFISRDQLGLPGQAAMVLSVVCLYVYLGLVLPAEDRLALLEAERGRQAEAATSASGRPAGAPPVADIPAVLKRLNGLAEGSGLVVERVAYQFKDSAGVRRLVVTVPVEGNYPAIRAFVRDALALTATSSLDELSLQRTQAVDPVVSAQIGLSFRFEAAS